MKLEIISRGYFRDYYLMLKYKNYSMSWPLKEISYYIWNLKESHVKIVFIYKAELKIAIKNNIIEY
jgi:hypothetical protein